MTKNKFIKTLRSWRIPESAIKNYTNMVAHYGGTASYEDIYKIIVKNITTEIFKNYTPIKYNIEPYDLNRISKDNYLLMNTYGTKKIEPMCVRRITTI